MATIADAKITFPVEIRTRRSIGGKIEGYQADFLAPDHHVLHTDTLPTKRAALEALHYHMEEATSLHIPMLYHYSDYVGLVFFETGMGWTYYLSNEQSTENQARVMFGCYPTKAEAASHMRRHMAQCIGGLLGSKVLTEHEDVDEHFAYDSWQCGAAAWRRYRKLELAAVFEDRALDTEMRQYGEKTRGYYRALRQAGDDPVTAWESAIQQIHADCFRAVTAVAV